LFIIIQAIPRHLRTRSLLPARRTQTLVLALLLLSWQLMPTEERVERTTIEEDVEGVVMANDTEDAVVVADAAKEAPGTRVPKEIPNLARGSTIVEAEREGEPSSPPPPPPPPPFFF